MEIKKIIAFLPANRDGCALWRMEIPHRNIEHSKLVYADNKFPLDKFVQSDIAIIQRLTNDRHLAAIQLLKRVGMKIVYDLDDNLWDIPKWNPAAKVWASFKDGIEACASKCDAITVSTETLAKAVRDKMPRLRHMPLQVINNAVDFEVFKERNKETREEFVVGWTGSPTHNEDTEIFRNVIQVLDKDPTIVFEITGKKDDRLPDHPRIRYRQYVPIDQYPEALRSWNWDLFLAPLVWNKFNRSKSNIKMLEAAAVGSPVLASKIGPYRDFLERDSNLEYLSCVLESEWPKKILELRNNPEQREFLVQRMRKVASENFNISAIAPVWKSFAESLC